MATASGSKTTYGIYAYVEYTVTHSETTTTLTVSAAQVKTSTANVGVNGTAGTFAGTGQTTKSNNSWKMRSSATVNVFSAFSWSWNRGTAASSASISFSITFDGHTSTASFSVAIPARTAYTISYNANGGSGSASQTKWYGINIALNNGSGFSRPNHTLTGWNTNAAGTGTHYNLGATYSGNAGLSLFAEWELNAIEVPLKVSGTIKRGVLYTKVNNQIKIPYVGFVKVNNTWKQIKI